MNDAREDWQARVQARQAADLAKIPQSWRLSPEFLTDDENADVDVTTVPAKSGILTPAELEITELDAASIVKFVQNKSLRAVDVATAFCKRAAIAQQLTHCLTETFFDDAIERGKWLDNYLVENGRPVGPFHGLPVSIKDSFNYKGVQTTLGFVARLDDPVAEKNASLVDILLDLGAILYCKTNIPQSMMTADSHNHVFGRTLNPHRLRLTAGGSSGGEGALVAMKGAPIGVGTDVAGSIRIPSLCNGTYGFKPSPYRVPTGGSRNCHRSGAPGFPFCAGPLTNSFDDVALFMRTVLDSQPWDRDAGAVYAPWRSSVADSKPAKLRVGYYPEDPDYPVHPPVRRALETTAKLLAAAGHDVVTLTNLPSIRSLEVTSETFWSSDKDPIFLQWMRESGEPMVPSLARDFGAIPPRPGGPSLDAVFEANNQAAAYKERWHQVWVENKLDVVLFPPAQTTAMPHDTFGSPPYTITFNLLQWPAIILPVGVADKEVDRDELATDARRKYNSADVHGAPLSIQLASRNMRDEELLAAARVVDQVLRAAANKS